MRPLCSYNLLLVSALVLLASVSPAESHDMPTANPYAGKSYGGCQGGYCQSEDEALELQFWQAADKGDAPAVQKLLENSKLNITRNIVPDADGLARVMDVAVWVASEKGHHEVMKVLLKHPSAKQLYMWEDGHILDMAAANGDLKMVKLLLDFNMTVGPSALAHAAHFNHTDVMELLLTKPTDLKSSMQAISNGGSEDMARVMLKHLKERTAADEAEQSQGAYDWHGDYVSIAVASGNVPVLQALLEGGYVLKWQQAQDLIKSAAETGGTQVMDILLSQKLFETDADELDEAVDTALKAAAELGKPDIIDLLLKKYPEQTKGHCKAGLFRAYKYGRTEVQDKLSAVCPVDATKSTKLQDAEWIGKVLIAARSGDDKVLKELLKHEKASSRLKKLRKPVEEDASDKDKKSQGPAIDPKHDPLVIAAVNGHLEAVKLLEELGVLCSPCAAAEAAKQNQTAVIQHLAKGTGKVVLQNFEDVIQDALRIVAYSMEKQNWGLVEWMLKEHSSKDVGAYFLPVIAQGGKVEDMRKMLQLLQDLGYNNNTYFTQQVHSAMISAALGGHLDLLLDLKQHSNPLHALEAEKASQDQEEHEVEEEGGDGGDKTEL